MTKTLRVLIVEDQDDDALLLMRELSAGGYDPQTRLVCSPEGVNAALREQSWDIVISDWSMPQFTGLDAFYLVHAHDPDLPVIIISGTISEEIAVEALRAGVHDFMAKGKFARLLPAIKRELREAEVRRQRRAAETALARQREETARSERLLRLVLESVPDGVVVVDGEGRCVLSNPAATALLGEIDPQLPAEHWPQKFGVFQTDKVTPFPASDLALVRALDGHAVDAQEEFLCKPGQGEGRWLSVNARPLRDGSDGLHGAVAVFRDVTSERASQEQLLISDRMASIGMLAAGVGHEINNPLTAVLGNLELAQRKLSRASTQDESSLAEAARMLEDAGAATERVRLIVRDLKIFARHQEPTNGPVQLQPILESSVRMAWNEIRHRARLEKSLMRVPLVDASESRLGQVFLNLIVNAAQAMPEGHFDTNTLHIDTSTDMLGRAVVAISDTGCGIAPELLPHLFRPFFTTKAVGVGTGLGLAICQRIVHELGGEISVESRVNEGTTFRVILPASKHSTVHQPRSQKVVPLHAPGRGRILVIDDEPMIVSLVQHTLRSQHEVVGTTRAADALERIRSGENFDVILCDLMMPRMSGMEFHARLQAQSRELTDRIIFMTGGAFTDSARDFLASVLNPVVEKPFAPEALRSVVGTRLELAARGDSMPSPTSIDDLHAPTTNTGTGRSKM